LSSDSIARPSTQPKKGKGVHALLRELSNKEDRTAGTGLDVPEDPQRPWLHDYRAYMDILEQMPVGWTAIQWWGISSSGLIF
jgi:hypothetical protein